MLSRQHGKIRAVARACAAQSKFGARLEPFMVADAQFFEGRTLDIITQAESIASHGALIAADYGSYTAASAMVETADRVTEDEGSLSSTCSWSAPSGRSAAASTGRASRSTRTSCGACRWPAGRRASRTAR